MVGILFYIENKTKILLHSSKIKFELYNEVCSRIIVKLTNFLLRIHTILYMDKKKSASDYSDFVLKQF